MVIHFCCTPLDIRTFPILKDETLQLSKVVPHVLILSGHFLCWGFLPFEKEASRNENTILTEEYAVGDIEALAIDSACLLFSFLLK